MSVLQHNYGDLNREECSWRHWKIIQEQEANEEDVCESKVTKEGQKQDESKASIEAATLVKVTPLDQSHICPKLHIFHSHVFNEA